MRVVFSIPLLLLLASCALHSKEPSPTSRPATLIFLDPNDKPASGATVVLLPPHGGRSYIFTGDISPPSYLDTEQVAVPLNGHLELPTVCSDRSIVAFDHDGYAQVDPPYTSEGRTILLQPWARVEGNLKVGSRPGDNDTVMAQVTHGSVISDLKAQTDAAGKFKIERVPAGQCSVSRVITNNGSTMGTQTQLINLSAGQTGVVVLGGEGRPIVGSMTLPPVLIGRPGLCYDCQIGHFENPPRRPWPDDVMNGTPEKRRAWNQAFLKTDAGKHWQAAALAAFNAARSYPAELRSGGAFRIEDVLAGSYVLEARVYEQDTQAANSQELASGTLAFDLPEMANGRSDDPFILPIVALHLVHPVAKVGSVAPDFNVPTIDGKRVRLADFRGKYVVLDNWAVYCTPCVETTLKLRNTLRTLTKSYNLTVIGLNRDDETKRPLAFVRRQGIDWPQAWVGADADRATLENYLTEGSGIWLIGPDGTVVAKDVDPEKLGTLLAGSH